MAIAFVTVVAISCQASTAIPAGVNKATYRYAYSTTKIRVLEPRSTAAFPALSIIPQGVSEVGIINVNVVSSARLGAHGLLVNESDFYNELARLSAELGGTHFHIAKVSKENGIIISMTVSALAP